MMNILFKVSYFHRERSEAVSISIYSIVCFVVPPRDAFVLLSIFYMLVAFPNISAKRFRTAKRNSYHLAVLNRLVVKISNNSYCIKCIGTFNANVSILK